MSAPKNEIAWLFSSSLSSLPFLLSTLSSLSLSSVKRPTDCGAGKQRPRVNVSTIDQGFSRLTCSFATTPAFHSLGIRNKKTMTAIARQIRPGTMNDKPQFSSTKAPGQTNSVISLIFKAYFES